MACEIRFGTTRLRALPRIVRITRKKTSRPYGFNKPKRLGPRGLPGGIFLFGGFTGKYDTGKAANDGGGNPGQTQIFCNPRK
jgi:hypothetical protein